MSAVHGSNRVCSAHNANNYNDGQHKVEVAIMKSLFREEEMLHKTNRSRVGGSGAYSQTYGAHNLSQLQIHSIHTHQHIKITETK